MRVPDSIRLEHEQLHAKLAEATNLAGRTGEAARTLARIMHPHLLREDEYAIPPLALLQALAKGQLTLNMAEVLPLVARLKDEFPLMIEEHRAIAGGLIQLGNAASEEGLREWAEFADDLRHHAQMEEEVLYPAAILVGEYVKHSLRPQATRSEPCVAECQGGASMCVGTGHEQGRSVCGSRAWQSAPGSRWCWLSSFVPSCRSRSLGAARHPCAPNRSGRP